VDTRKSPDVIMADARISDDSKTLFPPFYLPEDIRVVELYPNCPSKVLGLFARTSHQAEADTASLRLLPSAVNAEPESYKPESYQWADETRMAAIAILKRHPELLFITSKIKDHFGRWIEASPYRIFLGAGDVWALKKVYEEIIPKIEDGEVLAKAQFQAQFPNCPQVFNPNMPEEVLYDKRNKAQISDVIAKLKIIVEKINADPCANGQATKDETTEAVADLCKIFAPKEGEILKTGLHFPLGILKEIGKVYDAQFNPWSYAQLAFFSRTVIGGAVAALTAVDGQCVKNGLANLNMEKGPDRRDGLFCRRPKGIPQDKVPLVGKLGRTMFVDPYDGYSCFVSSTPGYFDWYNKNGAWCACAWHFGCGPSGFVRRLALENLWRTKAETIGNYYAATRREVNTLSRSP